MRDFIINNPLLFLVDIDQLHCITTLTLRYKQVLRDRDQFSDSPGQPSRTDPPLQLPILWSDERINGWTDVVVRWWVRPHTLLLGWRRCKAFSQHTQAGACTSSDEITVGKFFWQILYKFWQFVCRKIFLQGIRWNRFLGENLFWHHARFSAHWSAEILSHKVSCLVST